MLQYNNYQKEVLMREENIKTIIKYGEWIVNQMKDFDKDDISIIQFFVQQLYNHDTWDYTSKYMPVKGTFLFYLHKRFPKGVLFYKVKRRVLFHLQTYHHQY